MPRPPAPKTKPPKSGPPIGLIGGVVALVIALIAVGVYLVARGDGLEATGSADTLAEGKGVVVNPDVGDDVPLVHIYEDFQCPFCGQLEGAAGEDILAAAEDGSIRLQWTFMSFLDGSLGNDSSSRAANAALCANDQGVLPEVHGAIFAAQPEQEGAGFTDEQLRSVGSDAGLSGAELEDYTSCLQEQTYAEYVADMQEQANRADVTSTPTVRIDGEDLTQDELTELLQTPGSFDSVLQAHS